ncbi:hypothetical protein [Vibrio phage vB_VibM_83AMN]|nr:hypothetical protein [Vibrio phage vB_VibM_83AMN]
MLTNLLNNFPDELKDVNQWYLADSEKAPCLRSGDFLVPVNPNDHRGMNFAQAFQIADELECGLGFYLTKKDPYACIDLDVKDQSNCNDPKLWTTQDQFDRFRNIINQFNSYSETSTSGKGVHIWIRADIQGGRRRDGVEIYSQFRFIVCTGNVFSKNKNVEERQFLATALANQIGKSADEEEYKLVELEPTEADEVIWERAISAENGDKFKSLCRGEWESLGYPSQSEADLSLMSMFTYYTQSNSQCRRMFRMTNLGTRKKATKSDYHVDRLLRIIRSRQAFEEKQNKASMIDAQMLVEALNNKHKQANESEKNIGKEFNEKVNSGTTNADGSIDDSELPWPPGLAGDLAKFVHDSSMRPVKTVSIITAISALAGLCGRQWNITRSGLNMYLVLIARSAIGKEAMHSGLSAISNQLEVKVPGSRKFFDFNSYVSGPALLKAVVDNPCTININSEWGRQMQRLAMENGQGPLQQLRTVMTMLYQKSDKNSVVSGLGYSDKANNINCQTGVSYSMVGESTPDTFYESITRAMMEDGFLSRFNFFEYRGKRPKANRDPKLVMDPILLNSLANVAVQAINLSSSKQTQDVQFHDDAWDILCDFDDECDKHINANEDESIRQMWNRAHLKVSRMCALLAVADNPYNPVVYTNHVVWALECVRADMGMMYQRLIEGSIGKDDNSRERKIIDFIVNYFRRQVPDSYVYRDSLRQMGIIPRSDIARRMHSVAAFSGHRLGTNQAVDQTLRSLCDSGMLREVDKGKMLEVNFTGRCFYVQDLLFKSYEMNNLRK